MLVLSLNCVILFFPRENKKTTQKIIAKININIPVWLRVNVLNDDFSIPDRVINLKTNTICGCLIWRACNNCNNYHCVEIRIKSTNMKIEIGEIGINIIDIIKLQNNSNDSNNNSDDESYCECDYDSNDSNDESETLCGFMSLYDNNDLANFVSDIIEPRDI